MNLARPSSRSIRKILFLSHLGFIVSGVLTVMLGPTLPALAARWSLNDSQAGNFFIAQFLGLLAGVVASSFVIPRRGFRSSFVIAFLAMGLGAATLGRGSWSLALGSLFLLGIGNGWLSAATNLWVGEAVPEGTAGALSLVNFSWTLGAVACPFLFDFFRPPQGMLRLLLALGIFSALLAAAFAASHVDSIHVSQATAAADPVGGTLCADRYAAMFILLFFLYIGAETGLGGWLGAYSPRAVPSATTWILTPSFFWVGMLVGRGSVPLVLRRVREKALVQSCAIVAVAGVAILIRSQTLATIFASALICGLGCSAIFPLLFSWLSAHYRVQARRAAGLMIAAGELGAALLPWLIGVTSSRFGELRYGLALLFIAFSGVFALVSIYPAARHRGSTPSP